MKIWLAQYFVLFSCGIFALGCTSDPESGETRADAASSAGDQSSDSQSDASGVDVEDPCAPTLQRWDFEQTMPDPDPFAIGTRQRQGSMQISAASQETVGARVHSGILTIEIHEPEEEFGSASITIHVLPKTSGALPSRHELVERQEGSTGGSEGYLTTHILASSSTGAPAGIPTSTQLMPSVAGYIQFDTCPNEVGQMAIGHFEQSELTIPFFGSSILNGDFSVVVMESDGSLLCGPPTVCSY